jgi:ribonuclease VapC
VPVLDASALLAYTRDEVGGERVEEAIGEGGAISIVNVAEVLSTEAKAGVDPAAYRARLIARGLLGGTLIVHPFTDEDAVEAARLRPLTESAGLSLADRACLALARRLDAPALTADGAWAKVKVDVEVRLIR